MAGRWGSLRAASPGTKPLPEEGAHGLGQARRAPHCQQVSLSAQMRAVELADESSKRRLEKYMPCRPLCSGQNLNTPILRARNSGSQPCMPGLAPGGRRTSAAFRRRKTYPQAGCWPPPPGVRRGLSATPTRYTLGEPARTHGTLLKSRHQFSLIASRGSERAVSARSRPSRKTCGIGSSRPSTCAGHTGQKAKLG